MAKQLQWVTANIVANVNLDEVNALYASRDGSTEADVNLDGSFTVGELHDWNLQHTDTCKHQRCQ